MAKSAMTLTSDQWLCTVAIG